MAVILEEKFKNYGKVLSARQPRFCFNNNFALVMYYKICIFVYTLSIYIPFLLKNMSHFSLRSTYSSLAQKMKFFIKDFFSKCDQVRSFLEVDVLLKL